MEIDVARLRHLVVDLAQRRGHLVAQRAGDDHHVGLARRGARGKPKRSRSQRGMEACIISTAQQASPKVIHIKEPVRAQLMRSSVVVTRKPLSASLSKPR